MKNKNVIIGIVVAVIVAAVVACIFIFSNNNNTSTTGSNENQGNGNSIVSKNKDVDAIDNNDNYYISIKGKKFKVGDKIANLKEVGLKPIDENKSKTFRQNNYDIQDGDIENEAGENVFNILPYNPTTDRITFEDAVIGGFVVGDYQYSKIDQEVLDLDIEVGGGIKLGSSLEDVKKVFGETDDTYKASSMGYTEYTYKSKEAKRTYEFRIDKDGKVCKIYWKNFDYNN